MQYVRLNKRESIVSVCEGDKTEKKTGETREGERSKCMVEPGPVSKMGLEGSPSSLHPALP